jgi:hypothetical protein
MMAAGSVADQLGVLTLYEPEGGDATVEYVFFRRLLICSIVAVHGLNGHRINTWTATNGVCWLRDKNMLPAQFPTARILTYGYAAYTHTDGPNQVQHETLYGHGQGLLQKLALKRGKEVRAIQFM